MRGSHYIVYILKNIIYNTTTIRNTIVYRIVTISGQSVSRGKMRWTITIIRIALALQHSAHAAGSVEKRENVYVFCGSESHNKKKDNLYTISNVILGAVRELFVGVVACAAFAVCGKGIWDFPLGNFLLYFPKNIQKTSAPLHISHLK